MKCILQTCESKSDEAWELTKASETNLQARECNREEAHNLPCVITIQCRDLQTQSRWTAGNVSCKSDHNHVLQVTENAITMIPATNTMQPYQTPWNCRKQSQWEPPVANVTGMLCLHPSSEKQECDCNRLHKPQEQLQWLWSATMIATSSKKVKLWNKTWQSTYFLAFVAQCNTKACLY